MSGRRIPIWKALDEAGNHPWTDRWGLSVAGVVVFCAAVFFVARITSWLSDTTLFWLKLASFIITAMLGVVGVVTDFKDEKKNLTTSGKLNLAGLALSAVIGIMAQKAEYASNKKASDEAREKLSELNRQNQAVLLNVGALLSSNKELFKTTNETNTLSQQALHQVARNLESVGDTILVSYRANFTLEDPALKMYSMHFLERARNLQYDKEDSFRDADTFVERVRSESGEPIYQIRFDLKSAFALDVPPTEMWLTTVPFDIRFHKGPPHLLGECVRFSEKAIASYGFDEALSIRREPWSGTYLHWGPLALGYHTNESFVSQHSEQSVVFSSGASTALSALDFRQTYLTVWVYSGSLTEFTSFHLLIGKRSFKIPVKEISLQHNSACPGFTYQLPKISSN